MVSFCWSSVHPWCIQIALLVMINSLMILSLLLSASALSQLLFPLETYSPLLMILAWTKSSITVSVRVQNSSGCWDYLVERKKCDTGSERCFAVFPSAHGSFSTTHPGKLYIRIRKEYYEPSQTFWWSILNQSCSWTTGYLHCIEGTFSHMAVFLLKIFWSLERLSDASLSLFM